VQDGRNRSVDAPNSRVFGEERTDRLVSAPRQLHLWHVPAAQHAVTGVRESLGDVPRERDRQERDAATPDEQSV